MSEEGNDIRALFIRQRRNLMALSLVLLVADIPETLPVSTSMTLHVHPPFTIGLVLWIVWVYWLWRYYTSFHDLRDKGFRQQHFSRFQHLLMKIAVQKFKKDPEMKKELDAQLQKMNATEWRCGDTYGSSKQTSLRFGIDAYTETGWSAIVVGDSPWRPEIAVEGRPRTRAKYRAWGYVLFRTSLFSEYIFPFVFAIATALYGICRWLS